MNVTKVSFYKEKIFSARWFQTWGTLLLGSMVIATGYTFFMTPYQIVPGGIYGISTILNWKLGFPIGMAALCFNLPLSLIGFKILGRDFGLRTFICFWLVALFADGFPWALEHWCGYTAEFAHDPLQLVKGGIDNPDATKEGVLLASIFGGVVIGVGAGLIFKTRSSSAGTDVLDDADDCRPDYRGIGFCGFPGLENSVLFPDHYFYYGESNRYCHRWVFQR